MMMDFVLYLYFYIHHLLMDISFVLILSINDSPIIITLISFTTLLINISYITTLA